MLQLMGSFPLYFATINIRMRKIFAVAARTVHDATEVVTYPYRGILFAAHTVRYFRMGPTEKGGNSSERHPHMHAAILL